MYKYIYNLKMYKKLKKKIILKSKRTFMKKIVTLFYLRLRKNYFVYLLFRGFFFFIDM